MSAAKYRPIREIKRKGTVSSRTISEAVRRIADLRKKHPTQYRARLKSTNGTVVRLVPKHS
jgi:hypothetical protein